MSSVISGWATNNRRKPTADPTAAPGLARGANDEATPCLDGGRTDRNAAIGDRQVSLWVKNLGDTQYVTQATDDGLGMGYRIFNPPRTFGATISHRFD